MKKISLPFVFVLLAGCVATSLLHSPRTISKADAEAIIEQVLMEQPAKFRPESVVFEPSYFGLGQGSSTRGRASGVGVPVGPAVLVAGGNESRTRELATRVYYSSVGTVPLYKDGKWRVIQVRNTEGYLMLKIYATNEERARQFVDAVFSLKHDAMPK